jgi:hypothetical protein
VSEGQSIYAMLRLNTLFLQHSHLEGCSHILIMVEVLLNSG